jgi:hypothetical protein
MVGGWNGRLRFGMNRLLLFSKWFRSRMLLLHEMFCHIDWVYYSTSRTKEYRAIDSSISFGINVNADC